MVNSKVLYAGPVVLRELKASNVGSSSSATVSFRIDSALRDKLANEAETKGMSLNAYVGECLQRCSDWVTLQQEFEYLTLSKDTLVGFLDRIDDSEIAALGRGLLAPRLRELANLIHGKADANGLLQITTLTAKYQYPTPITCAMREDREGSHIFLRHGISQKWSVFLAEGYLAYLEGIQLRGSYEATNRSVKITIERKSPRLKS